MIVENNGSNLFRGRMGNIIYYVRNGKVCARRAAAPTPNKKERTPEQKGENTKFAAVQFYYSRLSRGASLDIWRYAAKLQNRMAPNLFYSTNSKYFNSAGELVDHERFQFSQGYLSLPRTLRAEYNDGHFRVTWEDERNCESAAATDRLSVGIIRPEGELFISLLENVQGTRGDLCGEFCLPDWLTSNVHVYCFFARADETAFSESCYLGEKSLTGR